jgi:DNA-binding transcriptional MocR family regulator
MADIKAGRLKPGDRLPPHRDLAWALGMTVGTITRAYQEVESFGFVAGEVGRGTFVRPPGDHNRGRHVSTLPGDWYSAEVVNAEDDTMPISMQFNYPPGNVGGDAFRAGLAALAQDPQIERLLGYQRPTGIPLHLDAVRTWLGYRGLTASDDELVISSGAHNGILACLTTLCRSGGRVATESLVYPGLRAISRLLNFELVPVELDEEGMCPNALRAVLAAGGIDAVYTVPTLQNPTNATQSEERRDALAAVLTEFDVPVVEDDLFGLLPSDAPSPLCTRLPQTGFYVISLSKTLAPGLRVGFVKCPVKARDQVAAAVRASTWMAVPLMVELASRWILDGTAKAILNRRRSVDELRREMAHRHFDGLDYSMPDGALHAWLHLPDPWHASQFVNHAKEEGVILSAAHSFSIGRARPPFAVRVCLGPPSTEARLEQALKILRHVIDEHDPTEDTRIM